MIHAEQVGSGDWWEHVTFLKGRLLIILSGSLDILWMKLNQGRGSDTFVNALLLQQEVDAIASFSSIHS